MSNVALNSTHRKRTPFLQAQACTLSADDLSRFLRNTTHRKKYSSLSCSWADGIAESLLRSHFNLLSQSLAAVVAQLSTVFYSFQHFVLCSRILLCSLQQWGSEGNPRGVLRPPYIVSNRYTIGRQIPHGLYTIDRQTTLKEGVLYVLKVRGAALTSIVARTCPPPPRRGLFVSLYPGLDAVRCKLRPDTRLGERGYQALRNCPHLGQIIDSW